MSRTTSQHYVLKKLAASSLFRTYRQAFAIASDYTLELCDAATEVESNALSVWVLIGRSRSFLLVARPTAVTASASMVPDQRDAMRTLLEAFAMQLGEEVNRAMLERVGAEPKAVMQAKNYIQQHLCEKIHLDDVAAAAGACSFQLCRLFRAHTGLTMTEFVSRKRVENAKAGLLDPSHQIIEIADEVGFSSLSQFNRNFLKYAGESPTEYRSRVKGFEHCDLAAV